MKFISMLLVLCFLTNAFAECDNAVILKKGDVVKDCDRVGLSMDYNNQVMKDIVEGEYAGKIVEEQKKIITLKDLSIDISQKQSELWKEEATRTRKELDSEKNKGNKSLWIGIALGLCLTIAAGYALGQVSRASRD